MFDNDFTALAPDVVPEEDDWKGLLVAQSERGICRVVTDPVEAAELDVLVPCGAVWPFERLVLPRTHAGALPELGPTDRTGWPTSCGA